LRRAIQWNFYTIEWNRQEKSLTLLSAALYAYCVGRVKQKVHLTLHREMLRRAALMMQDDGTDSLSAWIEQLIRDEWRRRGLQAVSSSTASADSANTLEQVGSRAAAAVEGARRSVLHARRPKKGQT
jgi:hypothetical protein